MKNAKPTAAGEFVSPSTYQPNAALHTNHDELPMKLDRKNVRNGR